MGRTAPVGGGNATWVVEDRWPDSEDRPPPSAPLAAPAATGDVAREASTRRRAWRSIAVAWSLVALGLGTSISAFAQDSSDALQQTLLDTTLVQANAPIRMREVAVLGVMSRGLRAGRPAAEIRDTVATFRRDFDEQVGRAGGVLAEREYSDALYSIMTGTLKSVVPVRWLGTSGKTMIDQVAGLAKGPFDEALLGEQIDTAGNFLDESFRGISFLQPRVVTEFVRELGDASARTRTAICEDLGSRASGLGASFCAADDELVRQIDARGGAANTLRELAAIEERILARIDAGGYSDEERAVDRDELLARLETNLREGNEQIETYIGDLEASLDENDRLVAQGFDGVFGELESVSEAVDLMLFEELDRELAEEERLAIEAETQRRRAAADEAFASGQLIATLVGVVDPAVGRHAQLLVSNGRAVYEALERYSAGEIGTAALTGNFVGIGLAMFSAFAEADAPSPEQIMIEQLQRIEQQLRAISEQLARVDRKLDLVLDEIASGFARLQRGQSVIIADVSKNARLVLDTQAIVRAESNRLAERLRSNAFGPCLVAIQVGRPPPGERYVDCAYRLYDEAVRLMYNDEITLPSEPSAYAETLLGAGTIGRQTEALYAEFERRAGRAESRRVASLESWYGDSSHYARFLASSPAQAREAFPGGDFGFERIVRNGEMLQRFRREAAALFASRENDDPEAVEGLDGRIRAPAFQPLYDTVYRIYIALAEAERRVANEIGAPRGLPNDWHREWWRIASSGGSARRAAQPVRTGENRLREALGRGYLTDAFGYGDFWRTVNSGVAIIETELRFVDRGLSSARCGSVFSPARCYRAEWDEWEARVYLTDRPAAGQPVNPATRRLAGSLVFRVTEADRDRGLGRGPIAQGPKLCQTSACITRAIASARSRFRTTDLSAAITQLKGRHATLRSDLARMLRAEIADGRAPELAGLDDRLTLEGSYLAALTRFTFGEHVMDNDALYAVASLEYEVPKLRELAVQVDGFAVRQRYGDELRRLSRLSRLESLVGIAGVAGLAVDIAEATEGFRQLARALDVEDSSPSTPVVPDTGTAEGFVFGRTDIKETRWIETLPDGRVASIWIDASCASALGGATRTGDWSELIALAPAFDEATNPCS